MNIDELDKLFKDPSNRPWGFFYYCTADPRVIAPSRPSWRGYQINFAHPRAAPVLFLYLIILIVPVLLVLSLGPESIVMVALYSLLAFTVSVVFLIIHSSYLSTHY